MLAVSAANSLVGSLAGDSVGSRGVTPLTNGNYVVSSPLWDYPLVTTDGGAVTWGNGTTGITGAVSAANSLVGSTTDDGVGDRKIIVLTNGHYLVHSVYWDNPAGMGTSNVGAVTWANGMGGTVGTIGIGNSLIGDSTDDYVGDLSTLGIRALSNGHYVVGSPHWDSAGGIADVGAVTWGNGTTGITGVVWTGNSLYGTQSGNSVGSGGIAALTNGNYVVGSPSWGSAPLHRGAVTWLDGTGPFSGSVNLGNSLYGSTAEDRVGTRVTALSNEHYVVSSPFWDSAGGIPDVGAVTWRNGTGPSNGIVSTANSLYGDTTDDYVGGGYYSVGMTALSNGHYVVTSQSWDSAGGIADVGAVTWRNGNTSPITGTLVASTNSLVGTTTDDMVNEYNVTVLPNGDYVVRNPSWNNGPTNNVGAITWGSSSATTEGEITAGSDHSVVGIEPGGGEDLVFDYDAGGRGLRSPGGGPTGR